MKEKAFWSSIAGFFIVSLAGTVCHYLYELSGDNLLVGIFTPINESVWEHLKLLLYPVLLYTAVEYFIYGRKIQGFVYSRVMGLLAGLIFIPISFYAYNIFTRNNIAAADIMIYYISVVIVFFIGAERIISGKDNAWNKNKQAAVIIAGLILVFTVLTFFKPDTALFQP